MIWRCRSRAGAQTRQSCDGRRPASHPQWKREAEAVEAVGRGGGGCRGAKKFRKCECRAGRGTLRRRQQQWPRFWTAAALAARIRRPGQARLEHAQVFQCQVERVLRKPRAKKEQFFGSLVGAGTRIPSRASHHCLRGLSVSFCRHVA